MKRMISMVALYLPVFAFVLCSESHAQSLEDIKMQMIKDWERAKSYTVDYLNTMPEDKYSLKLWTASEALRSRCCTYRTEIVFLCQMPQTKSHPLFSSPTWNTALLRRQKIQ